MEDGLAGQQLADHLTKLLPQLKAEFASEPPDIIATIEGAVLRLQPHPDFNAVAAVLENIRWNSPSLPDLFGACFAEGRADVVTSTLRRLVCGVSQGRYTPRHRASLYRAASRAAKKHSRAMAISYLEHAVELDPQNTAVLVQLGKLLRANNQNREARVAFERALRVNPTLKGARKELDKLV